MIRKGDIHLANLSPAVGSEIARTRPVVIVSNNINNRFAATVTILPITTNTQVPYPYEVALLKGEGSLTSPSKVKANQIRTIDKRRLSKKIGNLNTERMYEIEKAILIHLGIK